jgi:hypothetical protein
MRAFAPSMFAVIAGVMWAAAFTKLIPAKADERPALMQPSGAAACGSVSVIARLPDIPEASGLAVSRSQSGLVWTHNDSGTPVLYAIGTDGVVRGRVEVRGAAVDDWEDVASGPCPQGTCLFVGDIGDNKAARPRIVVYRVREPAVGQRATEPAEALFASYPDGPQDAETLFIGPNGRIHVVTKGEGSPISIYRFPDRATPGATVTLERVATLSNKARRDFRITDGDISWDGKWIGLRTLEAVEFYRAGELLRGAPVPPIEFKLSSLNEPQGEGLAFAEDGTVYLASEGGGGTRGGILARMSCKLPQ